MEISKQLSELYKVLGIKQTGFAKAIGISPGNISDIMNGRSNPSAITFNRIYEIYKVNINWLITGHGSMFVTDEQTDTGSIDEILKLVKRISDLNELDKLVIDAYLEKNLSIEVKKELLNLINTQ